MLRPPSSTQTYTRVPSTTIFRYEVQRYARRTQRQFRPAAQCDDDAGRFTTQRDGGAGFRYRTTARHQRQPANHHRQWPAQLRVRLRTARRSEEHTAELQSLMRISYDVLRLKKNK